MRQVVYEHRLYRIVPRPCDGERWKPSQEPGDVVYQHILGAEQHVVGQRVVYQGNVSSAIVRPAEVLRPAVIEAVPSIIVSHNHPSADPTPSPEDAAITREIFQAAKLLGIELLDHVVIGGEKFVSLKERGLMA